ncbi:MAG: hypothetical protein QMD12_03405 [Candidatus Aenigmarchaeota archaeon]|nr:hypothetical protein [Candidatus Aenigmarchaeota archaeon]
MKKIVFVSTFVFAFLFSISSVCAVSFSVSPISADAGTTQSLVFNFTPDSDYGVSLITLYVPPCDEDGCSASPYYDVNESTISSSPPASTTTISKYNGRISNITWLWSPPQFTTVNLSFDVLTNTPSQDREDEWKAFYFEVRGMQAKESKSGTEQTSFYVLAPNLQITSSSVDPQSVVLNSSSPSATIKISATLENVRDNEHHGNAYDVVLNSSVDPDWYPEPTLEPKTFAKLASGESTSAQWSLNAVFDQTLPGNYDVSIKATDRTNQYNTMVIIPLSVNYSEAPLTTCTKCYVKSLSCPSSVQAGSIFDVSYEINATNKSYEIQTVLLNGTQKACDYTENYDACSIKAKTKTLVAPETCGLYVLELKCFASDSSSSSYCGYADDSKTCEINVTGCGLAPETKLILSIYSPQENQVFVRGNALLLKARLTYQNGSIVTGANVKAKSPFLDLDLFDDSNHNDDAANDGVYANSISSLEISPGSYPIKLSATKDSYYTEKTVNITVISQLSVLLQTDKSEYVKGETIRINGGVTDAKGGAVQNAQVLITLRADTWKFEKQTTTDSSGRFSYEYPIGFGDLEGLWGITSDATDSYGNQGTNKVVVKVTNPPGMVYHLQFISPLPDMNYHRGENLTIKVRVTQEQPVTGATVTCKTPTGSIIRLDEIGNGIYSKEYEIKFEDPLGVWSMSCQAIKEEVGKLLLGGNFVNVIIASIKIGIEIIKPESETLTSGAVVEFFTRVFYPNNQPVREAIVTLIFQGETVPMSEKEAGVYSATYAVKDQGQFNATIKVRDLNGNTGEAEKSFVVKQDLMSWLLTFLKYWWLTFFILLPLFAFAAIKAKEPKEKKIEKEIKKYEKELRQIEDMQRVTQQEYFTRKIDEKTFKTMMEDFEKKSIEFQVKLRDLKKELEKLKLRKTK